MAWTRWSRASSSSCAEPKVPYQDGGRSQGAGAGIGRRGTRQQGRRRGPQRNAAHVHLNDAEVGSPAEPVPRMGKGQRGQGRSVLSQDRAMTMVRYNAVRCVLFMAFLVTVITL